MEAVNKRLLSLPTRVRFPRNQFGEICLHFTFSAIWNINVTKFEKTQIHFKGEVFAKVAVIDAKAP